MRDGFAAFFDESLVPMIVVNPRPLRRWAETRRIPSLPDYGPLFAQDPALCKEVAALGWFSSANKAVLKLFNVSSFAELSRRRLELASPRTLAQCCAELLAAARIPGPRRVSFALRALDGGGERAVEAYSLPLAPTFAGQGGILVSLFDTSAQQATQEALRRQEARMKTLMLAVPVGVGVISGARTITMANERLCEQTGYSQEELLGAPTHILYPDPEEAARIGHCLFAASETGATTVVSSLFRRKDGSIRDVILSAAPLDSEHPENGVICAIQDTTEMKRNELERQQLELQLAHAQKMEYLGRIVAGLAHDYQSVLLALRIQIEQYGLRPALSETDRQLFASLSAECRRGIELSKRMLLFGRQDPPVFAEVDLADLVNNLLPLLRRLAGEKVNIQFDCTSQPARIWGDALMVDQILLNLVTNARDAMQDGGDLRIRLSIMHGVGRAVPQGKPRLHAKLEVTDTGSGIAPEALDRIFEPFFTTKSRGTGSGLGLMIVENIARTHFGWVELSSEPGKGASFRVFLPLHDKGAHSQTAKDGASRS